MFAIWSPKDIIGYLLLFKEVECSIFVTDNLTKKKKSKQGFGIFLNLIFFIAYDQFLVGI